MFAIAMTLYSLLNVLLVYRLGHGETRICWVLLAGAAVQAAAYVALHSSPRELLTVSIASGAVLLAITGAGVSNLRPANLPRVIPTECATQGLRKTALKYGAVVLLFAVVAGVFFHAVARHPESRMPCCLGDGTSTIREFWLDSHQHSSPFTLTHDPFNGAPEGTDVAAATFVSNAGIQTVLVWSLRDITGTVLAWNLYLLIGLVGSGVAMFALLDFLGCTFLASLFGGYILAFSPYAIAHANAGHIGFDQNWVLVVTAFAMILVRKRRSFASAAVAGASIALAFYVSAYQGLFAGIVALAFLVVDLWRLPARPDRIRSLSLVTMTYLSAAVALLPILVLYKTEQGTVTASETHSLNDLFTFAARVTSYAVPSPANPLFHWVRGFRPTDLPEQSLFIGYTTWLLAVIAVVLLVRRNVWLRSSEVRWWTAITMAVLAPASFVLSLPPAYHLRLGADPHALDPIFLGLTTTAFWRVYARFGVAVGFSLAVLAPLAITSASVGGPDEPRDSSPRSRCS